MFRCMLNPEDPEEFPVWVYTETEQQAAEQFARMIFGCSCEEIQQSFRDGRTVFIKDGSGWAAWLTILEDDVFSAEALYTTRHPMQEVIDE